MQGKPIKGLPLQMEKQPNQILWNLVLVAVLLLLGLGIYKSSQSIDYIWRWDRIPQYIVYQAQDELRAEFDGTVETNDKGHLILVNDLDHTDHTTISGYKAVEVEDGDLIFEGDFTCHQLSLAAGPNHHGSLDDSQAVAGLYCFCHYHRCVGGFGADVS